MPERVRKTTEETFVSITLNRASLGEAPHVFARINAAPGSSDHIAYVLRKDITVNQQTLTGDEISARLKVKILEENQGGFLVETEDAGNPVRWKIDRQGKIIPAELKPVFNT